jgi:putative endopeptidase
MAMARLMDEHPMNYLRVNANLQQFDEFLNFYGITEGDNMYLAPEDRVAIW